MPRLRDYKCANEREVILWHQKVKASVETMAYYNMILTGAIFQLLEEKGLLTREQVKERMDQLKAETKSSFQMIQSSGELFPSVTPS